MVEKKNNNADTLTPEFIDDVDKRDFYISVLDDSINNLHRKVTNGRIRDVKKDKLKVDMYRALFYGVNVANNVYKDKQIDTLISNFEKLKKGLLIKNDAEIDAADSGDVISDAELNELINLDERIMKLKTNDNGDGKS